MKIIKPSVIYLRKSQEDKELETIGEKETLARHKKILVETAEKHGLNVTKIYEEILSGDSIEERPEMKKLITDLLSRKYENLLVYKSKRNARFAHTPSVGCRMKTVAASKVTEPILQKLKEHAETLEFEIQNFNQDCEIEKYKNQRKTLEAEIEKLKRKRANIFDLMEEGAYTRADFIERKGIVDEQLEKINATLEALEEPTQHEIKLKSATFTDVLQSLENQEINIAKKNRLLKSVIERIDYEYDEEKIEMNIFF